MSASHLVPVYNKFPWQDTVKDKDLTAPVGVTNKGDRFIVATGATSVWAGQDGNIAYWDGAGWQFITKKIGMTVYVVDEGAIYQYVASWTLIGTPANLASAVTLKHTQNTDLQLDSGVVDVDGSNNVTINQNSIAAFKSENTGALVNTLYLKTGKVGIGTATPDGKLEVISTDYPVIKCVRTTTDTNGNRGGLLLQHRTTADMIDGFGCQIAFSIRDVTAVDNSIGSIYAARDGADNSGKMFLGVYSAGVAIYPMSITKEGNTGIGLDSPTTRLHVQVANTKNVQALLIEQLDTTNNPICAEINNDGTNHGLYIHQDGVLATNKKALKVYSAAAQTESETLVHFETSSGSSASLVSCVQGGGGRGLCVWGTGVIDAGVFHADLLVYSDAIQVNSRLVLFIQNNPSSTAPVQEIDNNGTGYGLYLHQDGVLAANKCALYVTSSVNQTTNTNLVHFEQAHASTNRRVLTVTQNGPGTGLQVDNNGTAGGFAVIQNGVLAVASNHAMEIYSNAAQVNATLVIFVQDNASSTAGCLEIDNDGTGHGLYIHQDGVLAASKYGLYIYSNAAQVNSELFYLLQNEPSSTYTVATIDNKGTGAALYIQQIGNLASGKHALYIDNNGTPVDGVGKCIRLDGCSVANGTVATTITSLGPTGTQTTIQGWIPVNIDGTTRYIPYW